MKRSTFLPTFLLLALGMTTACDSLSPEGPDCNDGQCDTKGRTIVELPQGEPWQEFKELFRTTSQGARMVPYTWLLNVEQADSQVPFTDRENMVKLGWVYGPSSDALPIGLVKDAREGRYGLEWAGPTCAACHTGEMVVGDKTYLVDGGSSLLDTQRNENELLAAFQATQADSDKLARFQKNVLGDQAYDAAKKEKLSADLSDYITQMTGRQTRSAGVVDAKLMGSTGTVPLMAGPGRIDAFAILVNEAVCKINDNPANCRPGNAPSNYPHVWGISDLDWVQANSLSHGKLNRNVGEVIGVYAHSEMYCEDANDPMSCAVTSSANIPDLVRLENWIKTLDAPSWPDSFGTPKPELVAKGEALYAKDCESCHSLPDQAGKYALNTDLVNPCDREYIATASTPICFDYKIPQGETINLIAANPALDGLKAANCGQEVTIGTDPFLASNFLTRTAEMGAFAPLLVQRDAAGKPINGDTAENHKIESAVKLLAIVQKLLVGRAMALECAMSGLNESECEAHELASRDFRGVNRPSLTNLSGYKARQLAGIAFTAPYLHNGSVPSIRQLLTQPEARDTEIWTGRKSYNTEDLGFEYSKPSVKEDTSALFRFDTTIPGNTNTGHAFGPAADGYQGNRKEDQDALIEYLKTLDVTPRSQEQMLTCKK